MEKTPLPSDPSDGRSLNNVSSINQSSVQNAVQRLLSCKSVPEISLALSWIVPAKSGTVEWVPSIQRIAIIRQHLVLHPAFRVHQMRDLRDLTYRTRHQQQMIPIQQSLSTVVLLSTTVFGPLPSMIGVFPRTVRVSVTEQSAGLSIVTNTVEVPFRHEEWPSHSGDTALLATD